MNNFHPLLITPRRNHINFQDVVCLNNDDYLYLCTEVQIYSQDMHLNYFNNVLFAQSLINWMLV
jgi:hypothetical protein